VTLHHGDCIEVMAGMDPESVDAIVTDPPYNLTADTAGWRAKSGESFTARPDLDLRGGGFMGKAWDGTGIAFRPETWEAAYRVAKPSAYLLAFGGTRTVHRMTCAIEDAGWIVRDMLVWAYASGFPKSKASLKPAWEPIVMARKPGPLRMLAIDECRIPTDGETIPRVTGKGTLGGSAEGGYGRPWKLDPVAVAARQVRADAAIEAANTLGRWPANVILTDPIFDGGWDGVVGGGEAESTNANPYPSGGVNGDSPFGPGNWKSTYGDSGTYSRFFLVPKAARSDREPVLGGLATSEQRTLSGGAWVAEGRTASSGRPGLRANVHPTVKPTELMRHLVRLVTPTGGVVLDPFLGSGTTALAAEMEGFAWVGIEREAEYVAIAEARLNGTQRGLGLEAS